MPYHDEEYPDQTLWQAVVLFCCKGMIEGIMVVLFFWLLIQVLFTKQLEGMVQLEVHLQVLLLVGLVTFCLCLILGCVLCWKRSKTCPLQDQEPRTPPPPGDTMTLGVQAQSPTSPHPPQAGTTTTRQQDEDLDGEVVEYPTTFSSSTPSDDDFTTLPLSSDRSSRGASSHGASSEHKEQHPKSYFPLRRLSTPSIASPHYKPMNSHHGGGRSSFPSLPRLGIISKTRQTLERSCSITGHSLYSERRRLTSTSSYHTPSTCAPEDGHFAPIPLHTLHYGSSCRAPARPAPTLHFTMSFSSEKGTLSITVLSLTGTTHRLGEVSVMANLDPLCPCPLQASTLCSPSLSPNSSLSPGPNPDPHTLGLTMKAGSLEELQRCVLRLVVYTRNLPSLRALYWGNWSVKGKTCSVIVGIMLHQIVTFDPMQSLTSQDAATSRGLSLNPQVQGQLFILLQYQTLAHRVKAMVLQADNLANLTPGAPDSHVVINLRHDGLVIETKETRGVGGANTPFLFDLPPGDVTTLPLMMEFIVMQEHAYSNNTVLGRVLIGSEAPETGRSHWRDMCSQGQVERARWHTVEQEPLENNKNQSDSEHWDTKLIRETDPAWGGLANGQ
ncbi:uncharacterized protein LOC135536276 [Oncorhynchus masou masou]|uniref:uncharacterized protein LOC135536276 n=1 Tax=Oncorhynchus masou masou TaxID=90313 RepID=UPI003183201C